MYDLEVFWLNSSGQSSNSWKINQASHTYLLSQEFVCPRTRGWAGMKASTHPGLCELSVLAWNCGITSTFQSFLFILNSSETNIFILFLNAFFLFPFSNSPFVCLFSKVWPFICPLILHMGTFLPSPGWQHTIYSDEPQGALHGRWVSKSVGKVLWKPPGIFCWFL